MTKMTTEEAFIKVLQKHGINQAFGLVGSAYMPILALFAKAGITFWDAAHESNSGFMADGYTRSSGEMCMLIAQNGPGITNFVTAVKTAHANHTPMLIVTPQAENKTMGQQGFQEAEQMSIFKNLVCYQEEVRDPSRMAEVLHRVVEQAKKGSAPAQINVPRDMWQRVVDIEFSEPLNLEKQPGGNEAIKKAVQLLTVAKNPVIVSGGGVVSGKAIEVCKKLAEKLTAPVCLTFQHNDSFHDSHPLAVGALGDNGSKAAMELIKKADVVLAVGTRLNSTSLTPAYGLEYWPHRASLIQVDSNPYNIGITKKVTVGICGDAKLVMEKLERELLLKTDETKRKQKLKIISRIKLDWKKELLSQNHEKDVRGENWNKKARKGNRSLLSPRQAWKAIQSVLPIGAIIATDCGNNCAVGRAYLAFEEGGKYLPTGPYGACGYSFPAALGAKIACPKTPVIGFAGDGAFGISMNELISCARKKWPSITMVIFKNHLWGGPKRDSISLFNDNAVGTELNSKLSFAKVANACGVKGVTVKTMKATREAMKQSYEDQQNGITTIIEVIVNQELGVVFRQDVMKKLVRVADININDMKSQKRKD